MGKERMITLIVIVFFVFFLIGLGVYSALKEKDSDSENECQVDSDCVPASCCHPNSCLALSSGVVPDCKTALCSQECKSGTLDCGQGSCYCLSEKCEVQFK